MQLYQLLFPNGKKYIGITSKTAKHRFNVHCSTPVLRRSAVHRAIHKFGKESVILTVLAECDNWELLCLAEQEAIEKFNTYNPNGYNITLGGEGSIGMVQSKETIKKRAEKLKNPSFETKEKRRIANTGKVRSNEIRKKMSLAQKGHAVSDETKNKLSVIAKNMPKEQREKIGASRKGKAMSDDTKLKLSKSNTGRIMSEETKAKMSLAKRNISDETRKRISDSAKKRGISKEQRAIFMETRNRNKLNSILILQFDIFGY